MTSEFMLDSSIKDDQTSGRLHAASKLLKSFANETRLMILTVLIEGERSVGDIETHLKLRQPTVSQQLARLRADHLVKTRREGKVIYYSLADSQAVEVLQLLKKLFGHHISGER